MGDLVTGKVPGFGVVEFIKAKLYGETMAFWEGLGLPIIRFYSFTP